VNEKHSKSTPVKIYSRSKRENRIFGKVGSRSSNSIGNDRSIKRVANSIAGSY
jgi:hypothetical protein